MERIEKECVRFRNAIAVCKDKLQTPTMKYFPRGSCGTTCRLLAYYLDTIGLGEFEYVCGNLNTCNSQYHIWNASSHAWLEQEGIAVDITGTQFHFITNDVNIVEASAYKAMFKIHLRTDYWGSYDGYSPSTKKKSLKNDRLWDDYCKIIEVI